MNLVQTLNPRSNRFILIDLDTGKILGINHDEGIPFGEIPYATGNELIDIMTGKDKT
jgi:hypothetical protein